MAAALVAEPGGGAFPEPGMILDYGEARLRERAKLGFRAATLLAATRRMLEDGAIGPDGEGRDDRLGYDYLLALKGIGPYAAAHCRVLLQDFARIPIDATVVSYLRERQNCKAAEFAARHVACGPYLALGYRLLRLSDKLTFPDCRNGDAVRCDPRRGLRPPRPGPRRAACSPSGQAQGGARQRRRAACAGRRRHGGTRPALRPAAAIGKTPRLRPSGLDRARSRPA